MDQSSDVANIIAEVCKVFLVTRQSRSQFFGNIVVFILENQAVLNAINSVWKQSFLDSWVDSLYDFLNGGSRFHEDLQ